MANYEIKYQNALALAKKCLQDGTISQCAIDYIETIFPELKESEDELTWLKNYISEEAYSLSIDIRDNIDRITLKNLQKSLAWLEKQSGQKSTDKIQIGKEYKCIASPRYTTFMRSKIYKPEDKFLCNFMNFCSNCFESIEDSEQIDLASNTDKVEPKFKVGDWIVYRDAVWKVCNISLQNDYELLKINNEVTTRIIKEVDENAHLWTINDAKDSDVLVDVYGNIGIYEKCYDFDWMSYCSLGINGGFQNFKVEHENDKTHPASKEQRDFLFKRMKDEGFEWDSEKKELIKIE